MKIKLLNHLFFRDVENNFDKGRIPEMDEDEVEKFFTLPPFNKIRYDFGDSTGKGGWEGATQTLHLPHSIDLFSLSHEAAHYLLSTDELLKEDDFGLGQGFQSFGLNYKVLVEDPELEEELACYLGTCIAHAIGCREEEIRSDMHLVNMEKDFLLKTSIDRYVSLIKQRELDRRHGLNLWVSSRKKL